MSQRVFTPVALDGDSRDVTGVLYQVQIASARAAHVAIQDRKCAENLAVTCEQGARPDRANAIGRHEVTVVVPDGISENVGHVYRLPSIDGCPARGTARGNRHASYVSAESRKAGRRGAVEMLSVVIGKPDRAEHAVALRLD